MRAFRNDLSCHLKTRTINGPDNASCDASSHLQPCKDWLRSHDGGKNRILKYRNSEICIFFVCIWCHNTSCCCFSSESVSLFLVSAWLLSFTVIRHHSGKHHRMPHLFKASHKATKTKLSCQEGAFCHNRCNGWNATPPPPPPPKK